MVATRPRAESISPTRYFRGYIADNCRGVAAALGLGPAQVRQLAANAIESSFASDARKAELRADLDTAMGGIG